MADYPTPSSNTKGGQVGVTNQSSARNIDSTAKGGQVPVRQTTEGVRGTGVMPGRGCVSPLGGVSNQSTGNQSPREAMRERPSRRSS